MAVIDFDNGENICMNPAFYSSDGAGFKLVEKNKTVPLYLQIYHDVCTKVDEGILKPGDSMPTEQNLMDYYHVSRVTVRKALMELINDGIILREYSKSAIIAQKKPRKNMSRLTSLREDIISAGMVPTSMITVVQNIQANVSIAAAMNIPEGEPLIYFHRIRYGNNVPIAVQDVHIREKYCSSYDIKNLGNKSIYDTLEKERDYKIDYADMILSAKMPTKKQSQELDMTSEAPLLFMKRTAYLIDGEALEYAETYYVTSRYEWTVRSFRADRE